MSNDDESTTHEPQVGPLTIDASGANGALWAALAKAQDQAKTVTKGGFNEHARYKYATAEDMIAAGRAARRGTGLALVTSWSVQSRDEAPPLLTLHWILAHGDGGVLRGSLIAPVQSSKRNGPDKQTAALASYLEGFVERGVMRLDREGTPPEEDRDSHDDSEDMRAETERQVAAALAAARKAKTPADYTAAKALATSAAQIAGDTQRAHMRTALEEAHDRIKAARQQRAESEDDHLTERLEAAAESTDTPEAAE